MASVPSWSSTSVGILPRRRPSLIEAAAQLRVRIALMDRKFSETQTQTDHDTRTYLAWVGSLGRQMTRIGPLRRYDGHRQASIHDTPPTDPSRRNQPWRPPGPAARLHGAKLGQVARHPESRLGRAPDAEPRTPAFREVAERDPPTRQVRELWCAVGRGGGKDSVASAIATVAALRAYTTRRPGEKTLVACIAVDRQQAEIVFDYITAYFAQVPALNALVECDSRQRRVDEQMSAELGHKMYAVSTSDNTLDLTNGARIVVYTNSFRAVRGRSLICAILDEVAFYRSDDSANPDRELYNALEPALARVPGSIMIGISSPYGRSGLLYGEVGRVLIGEQVKEVVPSAPGDTGQAERARLVCRNEDCIVTSLRARSRSRGPVNTSIPALLCKGDSVVEQTHTGTHQVGPIAHHRTHVVGLVHGGKQRPPQRQDCRTGAPWC